MAFFYQFILFLLITLAEVLCQLSQNREELLNWCLKSQNHKHEPGKEDYLHEQCEPWKEHACCTESVTRDIHALSLYNFTYDHCFSQVKQTMSEQCRKHFIQDNCFYECEPHIGLWVVNTTRKFASERIFKVPLCSSDCEKWFDACKNDYTCAYNWPQDFIFKKGRNICPEDSKCLTFKNMFRTAKDFCENVWDHSWKYTETEPCMHIWFDEQAGDANKNVAEYYIDKYYMPINACAFHNSCYFYILVSVLTSWTIAIIVS